MVAPLSLLVGLDWFVVLQRYTAGISRVIIPFHVVPYFRKLFRLCLSPLDHHDCREYGHEENVGDDDVNDNGRCAHNKIKPNTGVCDTYSHDNPAKVAMDDAEDCPMPFALVYQMMPPAYQELNDCGDKDHNADALVTAGCFFAIVVCVADSEAYNAPNNCDYRCSKLVYPMPAYAVQKPEGNGPQRHENEETQNSQDGVNHEHARRCRASASFGARDSCIRCGSDYIAGLRSGMYHVNREWSWACISIF